MTLTLTLTDGTTSVDLYGSNAFVNSYVPSPVNRTTGLARDVVSVEFDSYTTGRTRIRDIQRIFNTAVYFQSTGKGARAYIKFKVDGADTLHRAELVPSDDDLYELSEQTLGTDYAASNPRIVSLRFTRKIYEYDAEAAISITNANGTSSTGLTVDNQVVAGDSSYFTIAGSAIGGDAPVPVRLELVNASAIDLGEVYVGAINRTAAWTTAFFLEGEAATFAVGGSDQASGASSGGTFKRCVWNGTSQFVIRWTLTTAMLAVTNTDEAIPVIRFATLPAASDIQIRFSIYYDVAPVARTDWQTLSISKHLHVGLQMPFPPQRSTNGAYQAHTFYIEGRSLSGASTTLDIDFCQLFPAQMFARYEPVAYNIPQTSALIDDGVNKYVYVYAASGDSTNYRKIGDEFWLYPGQDATFAVLGMQTSGTAAITQDMTAKVYLRPRRNTI